jgi:hypothetical protein
MKKYLRLILLVPRPKEISKVECKLKLGINYNKIQYLPKEIMKESNIDNSVYNIDNL